jgi:hypothetical protein
LLLAFGFLLLQVVIPVITLWPHILRLEVAAEEFNSLCTFVIKYSKNLFIGIFYNATGHKNEFG